MQIFIANTFLDDFFRRMCPNRTQFFAAFFLDRKVKSACFQSPTNIWSETEKSIRDFDIILRLIVGKAYKILDITFSLFVLHLFNIKLLESLIFLFKLDFCFTFV